MIYCILNSLAGARYYNHNVICYDSVTIWCTWQRQKPTLARSSPSLKSIEITIIVRYIGRIPKPHKVKPCLQDGRQYDRELTTDSLHVLLRTHRVVGYGDQKPQNRVTTQLLFLIMLFTILVEGKHKPMQHRDDVVWIIYPLHLRLHYCTLRDFVQLKSNSVYSTLSQIRRRLDIVYEKSTTCQDVLDLYAT